MLRRCRLLLLLSLAAPCSFVQAEPAPAPAATELAEVVVTGEQPGPGLWRVSQGDHDLWILGTLDPLPKKMSWRAKQAQEVIGQSQAVLAPPSMKFEVGFFRSLTLVPSLMRARKNSEGDKLADVLPPELYARWTALKQKYIGRDAGVEKFRPMFAAQELYKHALDKSNLGSSDAVWDQVKKFAKQDKVPVLPVQVSVEVDDPKGLIKQFETTPREADVACLRTTIERIETDLPGMQQRANLWAAGDVPGLVALKYPDQREACFEAVASVPELRRRIDALKEQLYAKWMETAAASLAERKSTLAVVPIGEMTRADGLLSRLRAKGYEIEEP